MHCFSLSAESRTSLSVLSPFKTSELLAEDTVLRGKALKNYDDPSKLQIRKLHINKPNSEKRPLPRAVYHDTIIRKMPNLLGLTLLPFSSHLPYHHRCKHETLNVQIEFALLRNRYCTVGYIANWAEMMMACSPSVETSDNSEPLSQKLFMLVYIVSI